MSVSEMRENLKQVLKGFRPLNRRNQLQKLKRLGFDVEQRKVHLVLLYQGKSKMHKIFSSCTTSDRRMYLNLVTKIMNEIKDDIV